MEAIASPLLTAILNVIASILVSQGILDTHSAAAFVQLGNVAFASIMTLGVTVYSMYKIVELKKHQLSLAHEASLAALNTKAPTISQSFSQIPPTEPVGQKGTANGDVLLPKSPTPTA